MIAILLHRNIKTTDKVEEKQIVGLIEILVHNCLCRQNINSSRY